MTEVAISTELLTFEFTGGDTGYWYLALSFDEWCAQPLGGWYDFPQVESDLFDILPENFPFFVENETDAVLLRMTYPEQISPRETP